MRYQKALKTATIGLFVLVLELLIWPAGPIKATGVLNDDFESGQGAWSFYNSASISTSYFHGGSHSLSSGSYGWAKQTFTAPSTEGQLETWLFLETDAQDSQSDFSLNNTDLNAILEIGLICPTHTNCKAQYYIVGTGWTDIQTGLVEQEWYKMKIKWFVSGADFVFQYSFEDGAWSSEILLSHQETQNAHQFVFGWVRGYLDDIVSGPITPEGPKIVATAPATGSTITDTANTLTIEYFNIDPPYTGFTIGFQDNIIFSNSESVLFNTTGSGTEVISLADFGITTNGHWDLKGFAFGTHLDIQDGFLTTRGHIDFFSEPLVDPAFYLLFNVAGLETPYTFTDPTDWYSANVDRFPAPTALFTAFTGLLDPIFLKVAEFGRQVEPMFASQGAYDRGHALGEIFPFIGAYVDAINVFCGGFPMVGFFIAIILILTAMFVIRTIIKFIPFTGN